MTTSDKKPRRTTKSAKTAKTSSAAAATTADIPTLSDPVRTDPVRAAGAVRTGANGGTRQLKAINVSVTSRHREDRHASIALAAYFLSESRGFVPGHEMEDWLAAEEEVDQRLLGEGRAS